jgi:hypothetical protein
MIIKYGTSEPATLVESKNIPSWVTDKPVEKNSATDQVTEECLDSAEEREEK